MFLVLLIALGVLAGAAAHVSMPVFLAAATAVCGWLLVFGARERLARARRS